VHPDTARIAALWEVDHAIEGLKNEIKRLYADVETAKLAIVDAESGLAARDKDLASAKEHERALSRKLAMYVGQRDRTKEMLDTGTAPDYGAAKKQYEQCAAIADETESELLVAMEQSEAATSARDAATARLDQEKQRLAGAQEIRKSRDHGLRVELETKTPLREERWKAIHPDDRPLYMNLLRQGKEPIAEIRAGTCFACHTEIGPQARMEVERNKAPHHCRGCQRWLIAVEPPLP
jgi:predicted  nucleic acid-binding Zn-ribbon protein